jgi:UDP-GlcNAc:undecaprenyl-phosphate/decaprenyl-phosphate GlcNAc-1-phosphate transferase
VSLLTLLFAAAVAAVVSFALTPSTIALARRVGAVDEPSVRKVHRSPVPRLGGLAVIAAITAGIGIALALVPRAWDQAQMAAFALAAGMGLIPIVVVAIWDDIRSLRAFPKLVAQIIGAGVAVTLGIQLGPTIHLFGTQLHIGWLAVPLSLVWIVALTNAFNLVDGLDGLSAGLALISAVSLGAISVVAHRPTMAIASFVVAAALLGFLPFNIHPARVFLGDSGATAVGFVLACLALAGGSTLSAGLAILVPVLILGLPIADTVVTVIRRALRDPGRANSNGMFDPDRDHFHHRLMSLGLNHKQAVFVLYGAGLLLAACGVASLFMTYTKAAILLVSMLVAASVGIHKLGYDEFAFVRRGMVLKVYEVPVLRSVFFAGFIDVTFIVLSLYAAFVLKYDEWAVATHRILATQLVAVAVAVLVPTLTLFRVYQRSWRLATLEDLLRPIGGVLSGSAMTYLVASLFLVERPSLSLHVIFTILLLGLIGGSRASYRLLKHFSQADVSFGEPVVIYGAGVGGTTAFRKAQTTPSLSLRPIGFIDDDPYLKGKIVHGLPVLGSLDSLREILRSGTIEGVLIATDKLPLERIAVVRELCEEAGRWMRFFHLSVISGDRWVGTPTEESRIDREAAQRSEPPVEALAPR